ncbi:MAG: SpvB/TcaC N-terminal domain-containing protein [Polyangiales bacterium]
MDALTAGPTLVETDVSDDGASVVRVPIVVAPGRDGHQPRLALTYVSRGPDGPLGIGWALEGLSQIERCGTDLALDRERDARQWDSTALCLDGQRLVPNTCGHANPADARGTRCEADGATSGGSLPDEFHLPADPVTQGDYRVRFGGRERVRLEGELDDSNAYFTVDYPDGSRRVYGRREDATVWAHPVGAQRRPVRWLLTQERDVHGNLVEYHYEELAAGEGAVEETYLARIEYGHHETVPLRSHAVVRFDYRNRTSHRRFHDGVGARIRRELAAVESSAEGMLVRRVRLVHRTRSGSDVRELTSLTECDLAGTCRAPVRFAWTRPRLQFLPVEPTEFPAPRPSVEVGLDYGDPVPLTQFDRQSDGLRPPFEYESGALHQILRHDGSRWVASPRFASDRVVPFDHDGDGNSDALVRDGTTVLLRELVDTFDGALRLGDTLEDYSRTFAAHAVLQGDFDGDGNVELRSSASAAHVVDLEGDGRMNVVDGRSHLPFDLAQTLFADVNGDGLVDAVERNGSWREGLGVDTRALVWLNNGRGFEEGSAAFRLGSVPRALDALFSHVEVRQVMPVDLNRDGRDDLVVVHAHDRYVPISGCPEAFRVACENRLDVVAYFSNGETWGDPVRLTSSDFVASFGHPAAITWRDGTLAVAGATPGARLAFRPILATDPSLLSSVFQDTRTLARFEYDRFGSATAHVERVRDTSHVAPLHPEQTRDEDAIVVVRAHVDSLGRRYEHWYSDGRTERVTGRFLGFGRTLVHEPETGRIAETVYDNATYVEGVGFPFAGTVVESNVYTPMQHDSKNEIETYAIHRERSTPELLTIAPEERFPSYLPVVASTTQSVQELVAPRWRPEPGWPELDLEMTLPLPLYEGRTVASRLHGVVTEQVRWDYEHEPRFGFVIGTETTTEGSFESVRVERQLGIVNDHRFMPWLPHEVVTVREADSGAVTTSSRLLRYDACGRVRSVVVHADRAESVETVYTRNPTGLLESITEEAAGYDKRQTTIKWDDLGLAPRRIENAEKHVSLMVVHPALGVPVVTVDPNGVVARAAYDGFGRLRSTTTIDGIAEILYGRGDAEERIAQRRPGEGWTQQVFDAQLRPSRLEMQAADGRVSVIDVNYDDRGRVESTTHPHFAGAPIHVAMHHVYDALDRVTSAYPGAFLHRAGVRAEYRGRRRRTFAADGLDRRVGALREAEVDSAGRVRSVLTTADDADPTTLTYHHGTLGIETIRDQGGTEWQTKYDDLDRPAATLDPDAGERAFKFNPFGELVAELDSAGAVLIEVKRDRLGRPTRIVHRDEGATSIVWDPVGGIGRPAWVVDESTGVQVEWEYDPDTARLVLEVTITPDGQKLATKIAYDGVGRPEVVSYGEIPIRYAYDALGRLESMVDERTGSELWRALELDASGRVTRERWSGARTARGERVERSVDFDPSTGEIGSIHLFHGVDPVESMSFVYDQLGRLDHWTSLKRGRVERYGYDQLDRIRSWSIDGREIETFDYDAIGNLKSRFGVELARSDSERPHRITSLVGHTGATSVHYDDRGRRTEWGSRQVEYNRFDLPSRVLDGGREVAAYLYDGLGRRVQAWDERGETTYASGGVWEVRRPSDGRRTTTVHLRAPSGTPIHVVRTDEPSRMELFYSLTDVLGTPRATVDGAGELAAFHDYDPFGAPTNEEGKPLEALPGMPGELDGGFTGHRHDPTGFIDMGGRVYDPMTASFLTPDPVVVDSTNRQALHPYSYVLNSPTNLTDPTGFSPAEYGQASPWEWLGAALNWAAGAFLRRRGGSHDGGRGDGYFPIYDPLPMRPENSAQRAPQADTRGVRRAQSATASSRSRDPGLTTVPHVELGMTRLSMHDFGEARSEDMLRVGAIVARDYVQEINSRGRPSLLGIDLPPADAAGLMADGVAQFFGNVATVHDPNEGAGWRLWAGVQVLGSAWGGLRLLKGLSRLASPARVLSSQIAQPVTEGATSLVRTGIGSTLRKVRFAHGIKHAWKRHLNGQRADSLRTLDPGGTLEKWVGHIVRTATSGTGTPRAMQGGGEVLEIIAPMSREAGGTLNVGVRMFRAAGEVTWRLTTVLTRQ